MTLQTQAAAIVANADFREFWPIDVRKTLARAALTEGDIPPYAAQRVRKALTAAGAIERRMALDIATGEATLSQSQRKVLAK